MVDYRLSFKLRNKSGRDFNQVTTDFNGLRVEIAFDKKDKFSSIF